MASETGIANRALQRLGAKRIVNLTQDVKNARTMNVAYEPVRDALLRKYPWSFALKRAQLPADASVPVHGPARSFTLPTDFVRLHAPDTLANYNDRDWIIEGRAIRTNDSAPLDVRYIAKIIDPNVMDSLFRELLSINLAMETCEEITQSNIKLVQLREDRKTLMREAKASSAFETIPAEAPEDVWISTRA